jgi:hypothetical protein
MPVIVRYVSLHPGVGLFMSFPSLRVFIHTHDLLPGRGDVSVRLGSIMQSCERRGTRRNIHRNALQYQVGKQLSLPRELP